MRAEVGGEGEEGVGYSRRRQGGGEAEQAEEGSLKEPTRERGSEADGGARERGRGEEGGGADDGALERDGCAPVKGVLNGDGDPSLRSEGSCIDGVRTVAVFVTFVATLSPPQRLRPHPAPKEGRRQPA